MVDAISQGLAVKFCELCNWTYEVWATHKLLFDENETPESNIGKAEEFTQRLSIITHEYCLLQIAKLHDPAIQGASLNLTIDYIVRFGEWGERQNNIEELRSRLSELWERIKTARNKILCHNDLETLMADEPLGGFPEGTDDAYFAALRDFVNEVHEKWGGGPYAFNDLAEADVRAFLTVLSDAPATGVAGR